MSSKTPTISNSIDKFISESIKLQEDISKALLNPEDLYSEDIVGLYFNMINITSFSQAIKQNNEVYEQKIPKEILIKIQDTQNHLNEKFNEILHPLLIFNLEKKIREYKSNLKANSNHKSKTKKEIEDHAKQFEELREMMSTKEFVNQYAKILEN